MEYIFSVIFFIHCVSAGKHICFIVEPHIVVYNNYNSFNILFIRCYIH